MEYQISCAGKHSYQVEDFEFEERPNIGTKIVGEDSKGDEYVIVSEQCVPFDIPTYTAHKIE